MLYDPKWEAKPASATKQVLVEARGLIGRPENWCQEYSHGVSICAVHALQIATKLLGLTDETPAYEALAIGMGVPCSDGREMGHWNDAPGRTHAEVLAAFDRAIAVS